MNHRVVLETRAVRDLDEATGWIAAQSPAAAERWFNAIEARILTLARFPERCPRAREGGAFRYEVRQLVLGRRHGRFRILFTVGAGVVHVLHVRHGARPAMTVEEIEELLSEI